MTRFTTPKTTLAAALLAGSTLAPSAATASDYLMPKKPYKAEATVTADGVSTPITLYSSGAKARVEMRAGGTDMVQIIDYGTGEAYSLMEVNGRKTAMRVDISDVADAYGVSAASLPRASGRERIAGHRCKMYTVDAATVCLTRHNIPLLSRDLESGGEMRVSTLTIGRQAPSLFTLPAGYEVVDLGGMGGMGGFDFKSMDTVDGFAKGLLGQAGQGDLATPGMLEGLMRMTDENLSDDEQLDAALDVMLSGQGLDSSVLDTAVVPELTPEEQAKADALARENARLERAVEQDGFAGLLRESGMSEAEIADIMAGMQRMQAGLAEMQADPEAQEAKVRAKQEALAAAIPTEAEMEAAAPEFESLAEREAAIRNGTHTATKEERDQLERETKAAIAKLLGE